MEKSEDIALSSNDLRKIFNGNLKILLYNEVKKYNSIDELLSPYDRVCILYNWEPAVGHWTCVFRGKHDGKIYFFDSFGSKPDGKTNMGQIPEQLRYKYGMDYKYLTDLLYKCPYNVDYNDKCLQDTNSSTCGRYCATRMAFDDLSTDNFNKMFTNDKKYNDHLICYLTNE
jgi:hypothetical protein